MGKTSELFFSVHRISACSPTGTSPKLNFLAGEMSSRTGKAVPVRAISTDLSLSVNQMLENGRRLYFSSICYHLYAIFFLFCDMTWYVSIY